MKLAVLSVFIIVFVSFAVADEEFEVILPQFSELNAGFIDPFSSDFVQTSIRNFHERTTSTSCSCPSVFAANLFTGAALPAQVVTAIQYSQCLWSCILARTTPGIQVRVNTINTSGSLLASAGPYLYTFDGISYSPCALYVDRCAVDIELNVDPDNVQYYFGLDGNVGSSSYDFVTVIMHELAHGLGFSGFINPATGASTKTAPQFSVFDTRIRYASTPEVYPWTTNPAANTNVAAQAAVSNALYFQGTTYTTARLFAPNPAQQGSSMLHLDEATYPQGNPDSLMTPVVYNGEANHAPGRLACDVLVTLGYSIPDLTVCGPAPIGITPSRTPSVIYNSPSGSRTPSRSHTPSPSRTNNQCAPCVCP